MVSLTLYKLSAFTTQHLLITTILLQVYFIITLLLLLQLFWCTWKQELNGQSVNFCFFFNFCGDKSPFCGVTGTLCFGLWLTLPMGFKARVDPSLPAFYSHLCVMILRVNFEFPGQGQSLVPILHLGMVRLLLEWQPNVTSRTTRGRFEPRTLRPKAQRSTNYQLGT